MTFPYFKTRFREEIPANCANAAKVNTKISHISRISTALSPNLKNNVIHLSEDLREAYEERAAIMEYGAYDVYPDRAAAEQAAYEDVIKGQSHE